MYRLTIPLFSIPLSSITPMWKPPSKAGPIGEVCTGNLHKLWLSRQADREPIKRKRDKEQALVVCMLVLHYLPHLQFAPDELRMFPKSVVAAASEALKASDLPPGYDS